MRLESEYIKTGYFWLPNQYENKIPGILTVKNGGKIELEVVGHLEGGNSSFGKLEEFDRIIGHVENDGLVTLDNCFYTERNLPTAGIAKSKIYVARVLSGAAYDENEVATFNSLSFSIDCLDEWLNVSGIITDSDSENKTATIKYTLPDNISYKLDNGMGLEICFHCSLPGFSASYEAKVSQRAYLKLTSEKLRPLCDYTEIAFILTTFLCFATDTTVSLKNLVALSSEIQIEPDRKRLAQIKIYYSSIPFTENKPDIKWHRMIFTYPTIRHNAQNFINNWIQAYEVMEPAINLYFSTRNGEHKYLESKFLALSQGLETYHRRTSDELLMDPELYEQLVQTIIGKCPEPNIEWLKGRLNYGNEITLRTRLKRIIEPFKSKLGNNRERQKLLRKIVDTRNYLTHYNESLKSQSAEGTDLWQICEKMEIIFQLHFLKVIGFNDKEINDVVNNCYALRRKIAK